MKTTKPSPINLPTVGFLDLVTERNPEDFWLAPMRGQSDQLWKSKIFESVLMKRGKKTKRWVTRRYILSKNCLSYTKVPYSTLL